MTLTLSPLPKSWIFDLDGTLVVHNGYLNGGDILLPGVAELFARIGPQDQIVLLSARPESARDASLAFLAQAGLRIDHALFGLPIGERLLFNDRKPDGLTTAYAVNQTRNGPLDFDFSVDGED